MNTLGHEFTRSDELVGVQPRVEYLEKLLKLNSEEDDFQILGICGMGGIGKTTLASVLYDKIFYQFDACCFIENVSRIYKDCGVHAVQKQVLHQTLNEQNPDIYSPFEMSGFIRKRLSPKRVLIVLDNVDELEQLEKLAINPKLHGRGSRIIITTRDEHILKVYGADEIHKIPLLEYEDAQQLLLRIVGTPNGRSGCAELIPEILEYVQNLPLAIRLVGSSLRTKDATYTQWKDALERLRKKPDEKIMDILRISFEELGANEKEIFLHIACFFHGKREEYVKRILDSCGLYSRIGIQVIMEKSLITMKNKEIHMHNMLQELGKKIVREEHPEEPRLWSKLWIYKDFENVLKAETETNNVKAIVLDKKENVSEHNRLSIEGLSKLRDLRLLILYHKNFSGRPNCLSDSLHYLSWHGYPFSSLPSFEPYNLVELNLPNTSVKQLWEGSGNFPYLERVDLSNSKDLEETPNFEGSPSLKRLDLTGCTNLWKVHPSIGLLTKLNYLSFQDCSSLVTLDLGKSCKLSSLKVLRLSGCQKLETTLDFTRILNLKYLDLEQCTSLPEVHESIGALTTLKFLSLKGCINLGKIPDNINHMASLQTLDLRGCIKLLEKIPLEQRVMSSAGTSNALGEIRCLERLNLERSYLFSYAPDTTVDRLSRLAYLNLMNYCEPEVPFDLHQGQGEGTLQRYPPLVIIT